MRALRDTGWVVPRLLLCRSAPTASRSNGHEATPPPFCPAHPLSSPAFPGRPTPPSPTLPHVARRRDPERSRPTNTGREEQEAARRRGPPCGHPPLCEHPRPESPAAPPEKPAPTAPPAPPAPCPPPDALTRKPPRGPELRAPDHEDEGGVDPEDDRHHDDDEAHASRGRRGAERGRRVQGGWGRRGAIARRRDRWSDAIQAGLEWSPEGSRRAEQSTRKNRSCERGNM